MSDEIYHKDTLNCIITTGGELKKLITDYVGNKQNPENNEVTLEMVVYCLAEEFPELLLTVAEENFIRGYEVGLDDRASLKMES